MIEEIENSLNVSDLDNDTVERCTLYMKSSRDGKTFLLRWNMVIFKKIQKHFF